MKTFLKACLFAVCVATGCAATGCCGGLVNHNTCGLQAGTASVTASGTFTDSVTGASATISGATIYVQRSSGSGTTSSVVELVGTPVFTSPSGATSADFVCDIALTAAPSTGTLTEASTGVCGGVTITFATSTGGDTYSASSANNCNGSGGGGTAVGSWTLDLSSVNQFCGTSNVAASVSEYTVHGSLKATMMDSNTPANTGTLSLTF